MDRLQDIIQAEPVIAAAGSFGLVIALLLMWYYETTRS
jgi:hypothetical protein